MQKENEQTKKGKVIAMETRIRNIKVPWYLVPFTRIEFETSTAYVGVSVPFVWLAETVWYAFPKWLYERQMSKCVMFIPDYVNPTDGRPATGALVKPFLGFVIRHIEVGIIDWKWWKYIEKY